LITFETQSGMEEALALNGTGFCDKKLIV